MEKEGFADLFNSKDGKLNIMLLFSLFLIFILGAFFVDAVSIRLAAPTNYSLNASRKLNFSFYANWTDDSETVAGANCSVWTNETGTWVQATTNSSTSGNVTNATAPGSTTGLSYINYTVGKDGNISFAIGCGNKGGVGAGYNFTNFTLYVDNSTPVIETITPVGVFTDGGFLNITSYVGATIYVNITDNNTNYTYITMNSFSSIISSGNTNETVNRTMTLNSTLVNGKKVYYFNISSILDFASNFTGPGAHSVIFCASDVLGALSCSPQRDIVIMGGNVTQIEKAFSSITFNDGPGNSGTLFSFPGMDFRYGNGTDIPESTFFNPIAGNFSFILNFSGNNSVYIVGAKIDEGQFSNASRTNYSNDANTPESRSAAGGSGYKSNFTWVDVAQFIPSAVRYEFGIIQMPGTFGKNMYCNGTSSSNPNCFKINQCNATVFSLGNSTSVIPVNSACWLTGGSWGWSAVESALATGYTYIFVDHFSGGLGANDFGQPNITLSSPTGSRNSSSPITNLLINFSVNDINSTGINLTANGTVNVSIWLGGTLVAYFNYTNDSSTRLTCDTTDNVSRQNTTSVLCNVTYSFSSNGTYTVNISASDTSNNSNPLNVTGSAFNITIDMVPPLQGYFNITNGTSPVNVTGDNNSIQLGVLNGTGNPQTAGGGTWAQNKTFYAFANWSDNLTVPFMADLQVFNFSTGQWFTVNTTQVTPNATGGWSNMTFTVPPGHNMFEGQNISFRFVLNDTLGNRNLNSRNMTIRINDSTVPEITINGTAAINGSNLSATTFLASWSIIEGSGLSHINISIDTTDAANESTGLCVKFKQFAGVPSSGTASDPNANRNGSFSIATTLGCPLANGTHVIVVTARDTFNNTAQLLNTFTIQSGSVPGLIFVNITTSSSTITGIATINYTNITSSMGLTFGGVDGTINVANLTYVSSCNTSRTVVFPNSTTVFPFNESNCNTASANRTLTVTVTDTAGNSNTTVIPFTVDNVAPSIVVHTPADGSQFTGFTVLNVSVFDSESIIDSIGYFLDGSPTLLDLRFASTNLSWISDNPGENITFINRTVNFTPGTHTVKIFVNDTLGNARNSSLIAFTQTGIVNFGNVNSSINQYMAIALGTNLTNVSIKVFRSNDGYVQFNGTNETDGNTFEILYNMNNSINITLSDINGTAANWNKINFTPYINETDKTVTFKTQINNNWTNTILKSVYFNTSINEFIGNNNSYYGSVTFLLNNSNGTRSGPEFWWVPDINTLTTRTNISACTSAFTRTTTTPCWNYTSNGRTIVFVPHFSIVLVTNDTSIPTANSTTPGTNNQTVGMFVPNITVSSDALSCVYITNGSTSSGVNRTMTKNGNVCIGQTERFKNLASNDPYSINFTVTDANGNANLYVLLLNVSDKTAPKNGEVTSSVSTTTATVTITGSNESVNATISYGTSNTSLTSSASETDFNITQVVSLTGLTAGTTYYFNVTVCDFNENCYMNVTVFSFATSAAASSTTTTSSSSSSGGSATTTTTTTANVQATAGRVWDTLAAGSTGTLTINNADIAVTNVAIDVKNTVTSPSLNVDSLKSNPLSASASAKVYQYLQITKSNLADADASKIAIKFKVPKSWLSTNGVADSNVALWRYSGDKWNQLETKMVSSDGNNAYYEATTPGLSYFAIGNKVAGTSAFAIIDMIRDFYAGTSTKTAFDIIDAIRTFYGG